jgi:hypothetical protein
MRRLDRAILWCASWLAPGDGRGEWFAEWWAESCYARRIGGRRRATTFCLGAFGDALWLRRHAEDVRPRVMLASPAACLGILAILAAGAAMLALRLPEARAELVPAPYPDAEQLVLAGRGGTRVSENPSMSPAAYRLLAAHRQGRFSSVAFYRPLANRRGPSLAIATANLFETIGVRTAGPGRLVLSERAWRKYFGADPGIIGRAVNLGGESAAVAGILGADAWRFPGKFDAWLLSDERALAAVSGFVIARMADAPPRPWWASRPLLPISVPDGEGGSVRYECYSAAFEEPIFTYVLMLAIGLVVASTITPFSMGEYEGRQRLFARSRRWIFFAAKIALLLPIVVCGSLNLGALTSMGLGVQGLVVGNVLALRWAIVDQRRRCPVCLRLLTAPTRIGGASHAFLEWYGTELICGRGHGMMRVPEIRTSSYWTERWIYLDASWKELFTRG